MIVHYRAIFRGRNLGIYKPRHSYNIEVKHHLFGKVSVRPLHGYANKPLSAVKHTYANIKLFLNEWQIKGYFNPETGDIEPA